MRIESVSDDGSKGPALRSEGHVKDLPRHAEHPLVVLVVDAERLLELDELQPGFVAELIDVYLADVAPLMAAVRSAVAGQNAGAVRRAAHALKGASGDLHLQCIVRISGALEDSARAGELEGAAELLIQLEPAMVEARRALEVLRNRDNDPTR